MAAAGGAAMKLGPVPIAACFDALRGQVYGAIYVVHPDRVETLVPPAVLTVPELARIAPVRPQLVVGDGAMLDRKSTRLNSSHLVISYAVFCLKKKKNHPH